MKFVFDSKAEFVSKVLKKKEVQILPVVSTLQPYLPQLPEYRKVKIVLVRIQL